MVSSICLLRRIHKGVRVTTSTSFGKSRRHLLMGKKYKNLFPQIIARDNLYSAYDKAAKGTRYSVSHLLFREFLAANLANLGKALTNGTYRPGEPHRFFVYEPMKRAISAMPFIDRVAEHALGNIIEPIFNGVFLPQSYACRAGKGTHAAVRDVQANLRRMEAAGVNTWVLKTDYEKYFASVGRRILHTEYRRKISCEPTMSLIKRMIPEDGRGIEIGKLSSQLSGNLTGHIVDRWLVHDQGVTQFYRYMDDIVVLGHSREAMNALRIKLEQFSRDELGLEFSAWSVQPASRGINFVGYRIWHSHKLLRRDSVIRAKRKIRRYTKYGETDRLNKFLAAWKGHAQHADSYNLLTHLGVQL